MISLDSAWRIYIATRMHFLSGFNAKKYGTRYANQKQIDSRPDKALARTLIEGISTEREFVELCLSNFLNEIDDFLYTNQGKAQHSKWVSYWDSPEKSFSDDMSTLEMRLHQKECSFEEYLEKYIIDDILSCKVRRETLCILEFCIGGILDGIKGFHSERIKNRTERAIMLIDGRLKRLKETLNLSNYEFIYEKTIHKHL